MVFDHVVRYNGKDYAIGVDVPIKETAPVVSAETEEEKPKTAPRKRKTKVSEE